MSHIVFAALDAQRQPVVIPPGQPFTTWWLKNADGSDAAAHGGEVGDVVAVELSHPAVALDTLAAEDLERYQIVRFELDEAAYGHAFTGATLTVDEVGAIQAEATYAARPLEDLKAEKKALLAIEYARRVDLGYACTLGEAAVALQMRDNNDRTNWLALKDACNDAIAAGLGDQPCLLPIRAADNSEHAMTWSAAAQLMRDLRTWASTLLAAQWAIKNAIEAASDAAALAAIDVTAGWPA